MWVMVVSAVVLVVIIALSNCLLYVRSTVYCIMRYSSKCLTSVSYLILQPPPAILHIYFFEIEEEIEAECI